MRKIEYIIGPDNTLIPLVSVEYKAPHANRPTPMKVHRPRKVWDQLHSTLWRTRPLLKGLRP